MIDYFVSVVKYGELF